ncbi:MAG: hypothetical protein ABIP94_13870, partial [Planctomycetota bacterium]
MQRVEYGRLADVYGFDVSGEGSTIALFRRDVVIGPDIRDERATNSGLQDSEISYDFLAVDPDTARPDALIYEANVRGLTARHPEVPKELRGTYRGIAEPAVVQHLVELGVTAVELLPVQQFVTGRAPWH